MGKLVGLWGNIPTPFRHSLETVNIESNISRDIRSIGNEIIGHLKAFDYLSLRLA